MSTTSSIGTTGRNYSTTAAWLAAFAAGGWIGECYNDTEFTANVNFTGQATSAVNFIKLRAATGQSALDNSANALRYDATQGVGFRISGTYTQLLFIQESYVTVERLQFQHTSSAHPCYCVSGLTSCLIDRCIFHHTGGRGSSRCAIYCAGGVTVRNSLLIANNTPGIIFDYSSSGPTVIINCTIVAPSDKASISDGLTLGAGGLSSVVVQNCAIFGFTNSMTSALTGDYNGSDKTLPMGTHNQPSLTYANQFNAIVTTAPMDFRLKAGSTLIGAATTDTTNNPGAIDIFGTART